MPITPPNAPLQLLGGLSPKQFLAEYWQKKPLLVRQAVPGFTGLMSPDELRAAARRDDVESRLIDRGRRPVGSASRPLRGQGFQSPQSPLDRAGAGIEPDSPSADALMQQFSFIP